MKKPYSISRQQARRIALSNQGLSKRYEFGKGKSSVYDAIQQLGYVQIDTISVVERAHHHILWSRIPGYQKRFLLELQSKERKIFEYWAHAAAYLPVTDFRFALPTMRHFKEHRDLWPKADPKIKVYVLERIRQEGPLMSKDFKAETENKGNGWWDWKPAKLALQRLFFEGSLLVSHRQGFQRVYDLPERILEPGIDTTFPDKAEFAIHLIRKTLKSHGIATANEISYLRKGMGNSVRQELKNLCEEEEVMPVQVEGLENIEFFALPESLSIPLRISKIVRILSPFDNLVIQRKRLAALFDFQYQIECYVPRSKREYGYFSLPVLYGDQFIARMDAKADRKTGSLHLLNVVFESGFKQDDKCMNELQKSISAFAHFNKCEKIQIHKVHPLHLKKVLKA